MWTRLLVGVAGLAAVGAGVWFLVRRDDGPASPGGPAADAPAVRLEPSPLPVARGVHLLGRTKPNAAYAIETDGGIALVDTCAEADAVPVTSQLEILGLDPGRVRWILLTHVHVDHTGGAARLRERSGAVVHAGRGDAAAIRTGLPRAALCSVFLDRLTLHPTPVDVELDGGEILDLGGTKVEVIAAPGHSPGSTCYALVRDGLRVLFTGDVLMSLTDEPPLRGAGTYTCYLPPCYRGDADAYVATLRALLARPAPDLVLPGHPRADARPQDPRIAPERWRALLEAGLRRAETVAARSARDGADHLDGDAKELLTGLHYLGDVGRRAVYGVDARDGRRVLVGAPAGPEGVGLPDLVRRAWPRTEGPPGAVDAAIVLDAQADAAAGIGQLAAVGPAPVVYAPAAGTAALRAALPEGTVVRSLDALADDLGLSCEVIPLDGLGAPSAACVLTLGDRRVLLTGREPARRILDCGLLVDRASPVDCADAAAWSRSLDAIGRLRPDLWLPAIPVEGQNANLYDDEWDRVLAEARAEVRIR